LPCCVFRLLPPSPCPCRASSLPRAQVCYPSLPFPCSVCTPFPHSLARCASSAASIPPGTRHPAPALHPPSALHLARASAGASDAPAGAMPFGVRAPPSLARCPPCLASIGRGTALTARRHADSVLDARQKAERLAAAALGQACGGRDQRRHAPSLICMRARKAWFVTERTGAGSCRAGDSRVQSDRGSWSEEGGGASRARPSPPPAEYVVRRRCRHWCERYV